jgi:site-specific recombinase XerC
VRTELFASDPLNAQSSTQCEVALSVLVETAVAAPERHPLVVYLASLAPGSRRTMRGALRTIALLVSPALDEMTAPWTALDFAHTTAIRSKLAERYAPSTANRMLAALRGVLKAAFKLGLIDADHMTRACAIEPVRGTRLPKGRALSSGEMSALFTACDARTAKGARDAALLGILYGCGLRRAESVALDLADFDAENGGLLVNGKGDKQRKVFIANGARAALDAWLVDRGDHEGALFHPVNKAGRTETSPTHADWFGSDTNRSGITSARATARFGRGMPWWREARDSSAAMLVRCASLQLQRLADGWFGSRGRKIPQDGGLPSGLEGGSAPSRTYAPRVQGALGRAPAFCRGRCRVRRQNDRVCRSRDPGLHMSGEQRGGPNVRGRGGRLPRVRLSFSQLRRRSRGLRRSVLRRRIYLHTRRQASRMRTQMHDQQPVPARDGLLRLLADGGWRVRRSGES